MRGLTGPSEHAGLRALYAGRPSALRGTATTGKDAIESLRISRKTYRIHASLTGLAASVKEHFSLTGLKRFGFQPYGVEKVWVQPYGAEIFLHWPYGAGACARICAAWSVQRLYGAALCRKLLSTGRGNAFAIGPGRRTYGSSRICLDLKMQNEKELSGSLPVRAALAGAACATRSGRTTSAATCMSCSGAAFVSTLLRGRLLCRSALERSVFFRRSVVGHRARR